MDLSLLSFQLSFRSTIYRAFIIVRRFVCVRVACKAFMLGETHEAYCAVLNTLFDFFPRRSREEVLMLAADCVLNDDFIDHLGLPNARLLWDHYHLTHHVWKQAFFGLTTRFRQC